jgi:uncharacterized membrane protein YphA (DoxX/SURF4 family)
MSIALWVAQGLLAVAFLAAGATKLRQPKVKLAQNNMAWVEDFSQGAIRLISAAEVLGALGLVLPALTGVLPWLTPLAALGLALLMAGAAYTHLRRKEGSAVVPPTVLLLLAALVAVGRFFVVPL